MHREVCLKHRKNRREIFLRVRTQVPSWQRCLFFFVVCGAGVTTRAAHSRSSFKSRMPECQSGDAGASPAERTIFFNTAGASLRSRVSKTPRARGSTETLCRFSSRGGARWEGSGLISRLRAGSIPAPANSLFGPLDHSGGHSPRKRESTVQSRGGPPFQIAGRLRTKGAS
jgi:hypothetical protein